MRSPPFQNCPRRFLAGLAVAGLVIVFWPAHAAAQQPPPARPRSVLMLFSLRSTSPSMASSEVAFRRTLEASLGAPVDFHLEYLDLPDGANVAYGERLRDLLGEKYAKYQFDVVVPQGTEALQFVLLYRQDLFPGVPVVFSHLSRDQLARLNVPKDVTGALIVIDGQRTGQVAVDLWPETKLVAIVGGGSPSDRLNAGYARTLVEKARTPPPEVQLLVGIPLDEQLRRVADLPEGSVVFFTSYRADSQGRSTVAREVLRAMARAANAPTVAAVDSFFGDGIVGGDLIRYEVIAERAASLAAQILKGDPGRLARADCRTGQRADVRRARAAALAHR